MRTKEIESLFCFLVWLTVRFGWLWDTGIQSQNTSMWKSIVKAPSNPLKDALACEIVMLVDAHRKCYPQTERLNWKGIFISLQQLRWLLLGQRFAFASTTGATTSSPSAPTPALATLTAPLVALPSGARAAVAPAAASHKTSTKQQKQQH